MKLHENQQKLILHLIRLNILAYEECLKFLDTENTGDMVAMSYAFRPLTKNGYVSKSKDGVVTVLQKVWLPSSRRGGTCSRMKAL